MLESPPPRVGVAPPLCPLGAGAGARATVRACPRPPSRRELRPEIQGLRAVAVALVVVHHLWPAALPGGFVGVDVFFAISGFLITAHLLREIDARRPRPARRVLGAARAADPARRAARAAGCALAATVALVPATYWPQFVAEIRASTALRPELAPRRGGRRLLRRRGRPVARAPLLVALGRGAVLPRLAGRCWRSRGAGARRRRAALARRDRRPARCASLAYSIHLTARRAGRRRTSSRPTRAWEFGLGAPARASPAARALPRGRAAPGSGSPRSARPPRSSRPPTPFPGVAALLPVAGRARRDRGARRPAASLARRARRSGSATSPTRSTSGTGRCSSSSPFAARRRARPAVPGRDPRAHAARRLAHQAPRRGPAALRPPAPRPALAVRRAGVGRCVLGACSAARGLPRAADRAAPSAPPRRCSPRSPRCFGAAARDPRRPCDEPAAAADRRPDAARRRATGATPRARSSSAAACCTCARSARRKAQATATIALVGDSHASHWRAAVDPVARAPRLARALDHALRLPVHARDQGPAASPTAPTACELEPRRRCAWLQRHREVHDRVRLGDLRLRRGSRRGRSQWDTRGRRLPAGLPRAAASVRDGRRAPRHAEGAARRRPAASQRAIGRPPARRPRPARCRARARVRRRSAAAAAAAASARDRVRLADLTRFMCDARRCFPVVGGALVYKDEHHMTTVFARTLWPYLAAASTGSSRVRDPWVGAASTLGGSLPPLADGRGARLAEGRGMPRAALPIALAAPCSPPLPPPRPPWTSRATGRSPTACRRRIDRYWDDRDGLYSGLSAGAHSDVLLTLAVAAQRGHQGPARNDRRARRLVDALVDSPPFVATAPPRWKDAQTHAPGFVASMHTHPVQPAPRRRQRGHRRAPLRVARAPRARALERRRRPRSPTASTAPRWAPTGAGRRSASTRSTGTRSCTPRTRP